MSHNPNNLFPDFIPSTIDMLDYKIACFTLTEATSWCLKAVKDSRPKLLVTLNPEIIVQAEKLSNTKEALLNADLTVADGVGVLWAAKQFGHKLPERLAGIELMLNILEKGGSNLSVYFLGAKPNVAEKAASKAQTLYNTQVAGVQHGYFKRSEETPKVISNIRKSGAHLLLAGLGEGQELFLHQNRNKLNVPLMIGVGGALDVLSGEVKRTPLWTRKLGVEWAYRVGLDVKRWHRFPRLIKFVRLVKKTKKSNN